MRTKGSSHHTSRRHRGIDSESCVYRIRSLQLELFRVAVPFDSPSFLGHHHVTYASVCPLEPQCSKCLFAICPGGTRDRSDTSIWHPEYITWLGTLPELRMEDRDHALERNLEEFLFNSFKKPGMSKRGNQGHHSIPRLLLLLTQSLGTLSMEQSPPLCPARGKIQISAWGSAAINGPASLLSKKSETVGERRSPRTCGGDFMMIQWWSKVLFLSMPTLIDTYILYVPEYLYSRHPSADVWEILEATLSKIPVRGSRSGRLCTQ